MLFDFFALFLFCFHTLSLATSTRLFGRLSTKYRHTVDKVLLLMHCRHNL